ncbi:2OG-Fe(II) oxygenase family protein [Sphingomonas sp. HF-S4]|uniref:2OG-Fe(II) oxygenase family protein n=1 Tax=Sphingomonas agrestis TaxID=3080540 RepID=A0ABU3Y9G6_9SPHN|nr:2OG-Fe(II) oxygenase family protein [Sphingomonas sp. HF-S4]MDV3458046.1 2OG-Fe(II) oxygenase family protein [Sphingomonas sp. HF-S4]
MIRINPAHDPDVLKLAFQADRRMQIRDFFIAEDAERIHGLLSSETPWWLAYNVGSEVRQLPPDYLASLSQAELNQILGGIQERARTQYQFLYQFYPMVSNYFTPTAPKLGILAAYEFLNSPASLDFFRALTGRPDIRWADAQATLYRSGNFLKSHSDLDEGGHRVAAYVFNFTKLWERDWGGYLQFFDPQHDIEKAYRPIFNALNVFSVPQDHSVGMVSSFCYGLRYSITGWLRSDEPPGAFGRVSG